VPLDYIGWAMAYCGLYTLFALVAALFLFEDRDLA
jgi:ABC-type transport system involved in multi-copper enzyme maturation permease subunit